MLYSTLNFNHDFISNCSGCSVKGKDERYLENRLISSSMAFSETLKTSDVSRKRRFSVGTKPSKKMLMPE